MQNKIWILGLLGLATLASLPLVFAQDGGVRQRRGAGLRPGGDTPAQGERVEIEVNGTKRTGLVFQPKNTRREKPPLLIGFHGHSGSGKVLAQQTGFPGAWPEAVMIFPDGLKGTPGGKDPEGNQTGWQKEVGQNDDRDLALFDAIVEKAVATYNADPEHVYVAGFSNGGRMTYLLLSQRGDKIRAIADCASQCVSSKLTLPAKPVAVIHGKVDDRLGMNGGLADINAVLLANHSREQLKSWPEGTQRKLYTAESGGADTLVLTHPGPHTWPKFATPEVVAFFKTHK